MRLIPFIAFAVVCLARLEPASAIETDGKPGARISPAMLQTQMTAPQAPAGLSTAGLEPGTIELSVSDLMPLEPAEMAALSAAPLPGARQTVGQISQDQNLAAIAAPQAGAAADNSRAAALGSYFDIAPIVSGEISTTEPVAAPAESSSLVSRLARSLVSLVRRPQAPQAPAEDHQRMVMWVSFTGPNAEAAAAAKAAALSRKIGVAQARPATEKDLRTKIAGLPAEGRFSALHTTGNSVVLIVQERRPAPQPKAAPAAAGPARNLDFSAKIAEDDILAYRGVSAVTSEKDSLTIYLDGTVPESDVKSAMASGVQGFREGLVRGAVRFDAMDPVASVAAAPRRSADAEILATPGVSALSEGKSAAIVYLDGSVPAGKVARALARAIPGFADRYRNGTVRIAAKDPVEAAPTPPRRSAETVMLATRGVSAVVEDKGATVVYLDGSRPADKVERTLSAAIPGFASQLKSGAVRIEAEDPVKEAPRRYADDMILATPGVSAVAEENGARIVYLDGTQPAARVTRVLSGAIPGFAERLKSGAVRIEGKDPVEPAPRPRHADSMILEVPGVMGFYVDKAAGPTLTVYMDGTVPMRKVEADLLAALPGLVTFSSRGGRIKLELAAPRRTAAPAR